MPSLFLRGLDATLVARLRAYARDHDLSLIEAADAILHAGLGTLAAVSAGGHARAAALSASERADIARHAAQARWRK